MKLVTENTIAKITHIPYASDGMNELIEILLFQP